MKATVRKMGNSQGVLIPKAIIEQLGIESELEMTVEDEALVLRVPRRRRQPADAAVAAIKFSLQTDEGDAFLRCWLEGDFAAIRKEWPDAPEELFIGADPLCK